MSRRLLVTLTGAVCALWIAGVTFAAHSIRHEIDEVFDSALQETAQRLLSLAADDLEERHERKSEHHRAELAPLAGDDGHEEYLHYQVRDRSGRVLLRSHDAPEIGFAAPLTRGFYDDGARRIYTETARHGSLVVQVAELPKERQEAVEAMWLGLIVPLLAVLPLTALAVNATVKRTTKPVHALQHELGLRDGANLAPIGVHGLPVELTPIVLDLNRLLERLAAALEAERAFAATSAHELRNPIAAARAQAELVAGAAADEDSRRRAGDLALTLANLGRKVETMLQLARAEAGLGLSREETRLGDVVKLLVEDFARKPEAKERLVFEDQTQSEVTVHLDPDALGIAIQNLFDNALKHAPKASKIHIVQGPGATLAVSNDGPVVPASVLANLKTRFARGAEGGEGTGLGLYIADTIMRHSGGRLELHSPPRTAAHGFEAVLHFSETAKKSGGSGDPP